MTTHAAFLKAIAMAPDDLHLRLQYADWLEEHGSPLAKLWREGPVRTAMGSPDMWLPLTINLFSLSIHGAGRGRGNGAGCGQYRYGTQSGDGKGCGLEQSLSLDPSGDGRGWGRGDESGGGLGMGNFGKPNGDGGKGRPVLGWTVFTGGSCVLPGEAVEQRL